MILQRPAASRGGGPAADAGLDRRHAFSFADYHDPGWMGFGVLRVVNEDRVAPGVGFAPQRRANMEILSYVVSGRLALRDESGTGEVIGPGELHWRGTGHGATHSEYNASDEEPLHVLHVWIQPDRVNAGPAQARRPAGDAPGWQLLASPDGAAGSLAIRQQARLYRLALAAGAEAAFDLDADQHYWLQVVRGGVVSGGQALGAGDAVGLVDEEGGLVLVGGDAGGEVLLFELPGTRGAR